MVQASYCIDVVCWRVLLLTALYFLYCSAFQPFSPGFDSFMDLLFFIPRAEYGHKNTASWTGTALTTVTELLHGYLYKCLFWCLLTKKLTQSEFVLAFPIGRSSSISKKPALFSDAIWPVLKMCTPVKSKMHFLLVKKSIQNPSMGWYSFKTAQKML